MVLKGIALNTVHLHGFAPDLGIIEIRELNKDRRFCLEIGTRCFKSPMVYPGCTGCNQEYARPTIELNVLARLHGALSQLNPTGRMNIHSSR